jgi:hypothetical protein
MVCTPGMLRSCFFKTNKSINANGVSASTATRQIEASIKRNHSKNLYDRHFILSQVFKVLARYFLATIILR